MSKYSYIFNSIKTGQCMYLCIHTHTYFRERVVIICTHYFIYIIGFTQGKYNSCGHLVDWYAYISWSPPANILHVWVPTCQHYPFLLNGLTLNFQNKALCHWEPMTPSAQALGKHTNHSNPTSRACARLSLASRSQHWGIASLECCAGWGGLEKAFLALGMGEFLPKSQKSLWEPTHDLGMRLPY